MTRGSDGIAVYENREIPSGLPPFETILELKRWIKSANSYTKKRKNQYRFFASLVKLLSLALSATATVILGLQDLNFWAGLAFSMVALVTVINAIEPFFNWRSRWVLMEEAQYRFYRLEDDLNYLIAKTNREAIQLENVDGLYERYSLIWDELSLRWLEHRRSDEAGQQGA
jgi:hypothetical protein